MALRTASHSPLPPPSPRALPALVSLFFGLLLLGCDPAGSGVRAIGAGAALPAFGGDTDTDGAPPLPDLGSDGGEATDTSATDTSATDDGGPVCGDGMIDPGEACDGNDFGGVTCVDLGYDGGSLTCTACAVSTASCANAAQPGLGQLYSACLDDTDCPGLEGCLTHPLNGDVGFCTNFCTTDAECFASVGGTAVPDCNTQPTPYCSLDCSGGKTCPGGMECIPLVGDLVFCM
jgi:hypothetical protein